jgi:Tol biopolymer transport system component
VGVPRIRPFTGELNGEVAYKCGDYICLMRPDGTGRRTLTATYPEWDAAWSPDGRRLAFRGYYGLGDGQYDLYLLDANGCHLTRLTRQVNGVSPSWSPTGRQIAFAVGGINVVNADGGGYRRLTRDTSTYGDSSPAWSARNRIAFVRSWTGTSRGDIYTMNAAGSGVTLLAHGSPRFDQPSWSPDGTAIAFVAVTVPLQSAGVIEVANADGTGRHRVSPPSWASYSPAWTLDGRVVFLAKKGAQTSAYIVNSDGTGMRLLYPNLGDAPQIAWGPAALPHARC